MDIEKILIELKNEIFEDFETRSVIFRKYKELLENEIILNPKNVDYPCLLAMILEELRDSGIEVLEECYKRNVDTMNDKDYALLATNMAYFLLEDWGDCENRAEDLLQEAIRRNSPYPNTYYALGRKYYSVEDYNKASQYFSKAYEISKDIKYKYCEAVSLLKDGKYKIGIEFLKSIYLKDIKDDDISVNIAAALALALAEVGEFDKSRRIAAMLEEINFDYFNIEGYYLNIYFTIGDYEKTINKYDESEYLEEVSWLNEYFYSLKQLGKLYEAREKLREITEKIEKQLSEATLDDWDDDIEEYEDYLESEKKRLSDIQNCYEDILTRGKEVKPNKVYDITHECYYINCPRHYKKK